MNKHTPGPWKADVDSEFGDYIVWGPGSPGSDEAFIANIGCEDNLLEQRGAVIAFDVAKANAQLIAAAPELYEALKDMMSVSGLSDPARRRAAYERALPAIAKATRETR